MKEEGRVQHFIVDGKCHNRGEHVCNLGYACDGCPYYEAE